MSILAGKTSTLLMTVTFPQLAAGDKFLLKMSNNIGVVTDDLRMTWRISTWKQKASNRNLVDEDDYNKMLFLCKCELANLVKSKIKDFRIEIQNVSEDKTSKESGGRKMKQKGKNKKVWFFLVSYSIFANLLTTISEISTKCSFR
jgi:hypothetical protein